MAKVVVEAAVEVVVKCGKMRSHGVTGQSAYYSKRYKKKRKICDAITHLFIDDLVHDLESFDGLLFRDSDVLLFERDWSEAVTKE